MQLSLKSHNRLVAKIPGAKHVVFPDADHLSILKEGAVVEHITKIVDRVRAKRK